MTAKRKFTLIWLLLPLLLLRGLVPAGFMIDASGGNLSIVMCSGSGPLPSAAALDEHSGHAMHHAQQQGDEHAGHHGSGHDKHQGSICPFAMAGSAAPLANISSLPLGIEPVRTLAAAHTVILRGLSGPLRAQQSRAPPTLS
jgi:hypothetical protein